MRTAWATWLLVALGWVLAVPAAAQTERTQMTLAESLFAEGRELLKAGQYDEACAKLAESYRLDPATGTLMNLAACHEAQGRLATAWAEFREALMLANRDRRPDRVEAASARIDALAPRIPKLSLRMPEGVAAGTEVEVDHVRVGPAAWGTALPLDPGGHLIVVRAPGCRRFEARINLQPGDLHQMRIPRLQPERGERSAAAPATVRASDPDPHRSARVAGYWIGAGGLLALAVGSWFGVAAVVDRKNSDAKCNPVCTEQAVRLNDDAKRNARMADIGIGLGVVGVAAGSYLILTNPEPQRRVSRAAGTWWGFAPGWAPGGMSVGVAARW